MYCLKYKNYEIKKILHLIIQQFIFWSKTDSFDNKKCRNIPWPTGVQKQTNIEKFSLVQTALMYTWQVSKGFGFSDFRLKPILGVLGLKLHYCIPRGVLYAAVEFSHPVISSSSKRTN